VTTVTDMKYRIPPISNIESIESVENVESVEFLATVNKSGYNKESNSSSNSMIPAGHYPLVAPASSKMTSSHLRIQLAIGHPYEVKLCLEAQQILSHVNAGGNSIRSEALAMQVLHQVFGATTVKTEMQIKYYNEWWKKCDFITRLPEVVSCVSEVASDNDITETSVTSEVMLTPVGVSVTSEVMLTPVGVSVTRAAFSGRWNPDDLDSKVANLILKKLYGLVVARAGVSQDQYAFERCLLFIWSPDTITSRLLWYTYHYLTDSSLKSDTQLVIAEYPSVETLIKDFPTNQCLCSDLVTIYY